MKKKTVFSWPFESLYIEIARTIRENANKNQAKAENKNRYFNWFAFFTVNILWIEAGQNVSVENREFKKNIDIIYGKFFLSKIRKFWSVFLSKRLETPPTL